jgi:hypothetical protein
MSPDERIARAHRARQAMEEFFDPALATIEADYAEKMIAAAASVDPRAPDIIARLAQGIKVARQVRAQIEAHIADGAVAQKEKADAERLGDMTPAKRRLLAIGQ